MKKAVLFITLGLFLASCGGGTQYKDPAEDKGSREWGPREINSTVEKMVGSMYGYLRDDWKQPALLQVKKIRNRTSEHIDTSMVSNAIVTNLIKKRIGFIDDTHTGDALKEMEMGMSGMIDPDYAVPTGQLRSPNFYLYGEISDNVRYVNGRRVQYIVTTLKLYQLRTRMLVWQDQKEFLKSTKAKGGASW